MDLHTAIRAILKYQGDAFLLDPKITNALIDFQAYESHPALKNIFRTLHSEGFVSKIAKRKAWDGSCDQLVYEVERDYAFPRDLVEYILKSVSYGVGALQSVSAPSVTNKPSQKGPQPQNTPAKPWRQLSVDEREAFLNARVQIKPSRCGLRYDSVYIADNYNTYYQVSFNVNFEVSGTLPKDTYINLACAIYDTSNRLRAKETLASFGDERGKKYEIIDNDFVGLNFNYTDIGRILLFIEDQEYGAM